MQIRYIMARRPYVHAIDGFFYFIFISNKLTRERRREIDTKGERDGRWRMEKRQR